MALFLSSSVGTVLGTNPFDDTLDLGDGRGRGEPAISVFDGTGSILGSEYMDGDVRGVAVRDPFDTTDDVDETLEVDVTVSREARGDIMEVFLSRVSSVVRIVLPEDILSSHGS